MKIEQIMARAEKELSTATRNLETAQRRGAPGQDVRNLEAKVEYRKAVLDMLNGGHLELFDKVEQLEKENAELLARAEQDEARSGKAERERDAAVSDIESMMSYGGKLNACHFCKNAQCHERGGTKPCLPKWYQEEE